MAAQWKRGQERGQYLVGSDAHDIACAAILHVSAPSRHQVAGSLTIFGMELHQVVTEGSVCDTFDVGFPVYGSAG